jgi:hypothetical protein
MSRKEPLMKKVCSIRRVALGILCLLTAVAMPPSLFAEDAPKPVEWSLTPLLPPDTLAVLTVADAHRMTDRFKQTGLWQLYSNADVQKAFRTPLLTAQMGMAAVELQAGIKIPEILSFVNQGEVTFAFLDSARRNEKDEPVPDLLLSIQAREKTQAVLDELSKRIDQVNAQAGNQLEITQSPVGNYTVHRVGVPNLPFSLSYTVCDGTIIISFGEGYIERILALHEKSKAGPLKPADPLKPEALSQTPSFANSIKKSGSDSDLMLFVNWEALRKNPILNISPKTEREKADWDITGLANIRSFSYALSVKGQGLKEVLYIDAPAGERKGLVTLLDGSAALSGDALAKAPHNAVIALALSVAPDKLFDKFVELASFENPNARQEIEQALATVGQQINIDIKKELFGSLTGQGLLSVAMPAKHPKLGFGMPQGIVTLQIKDVAALKNVLSSLRNAGNDKFEFSETNIGDNTIMTAREKFPQGKDPGQLAYAIDKNDLIVGLYPLAVRDELRRRQNPKPASPSDVRKPILNSEGSLADDEDFKSASASIGGSPQFLLYADTGALAVAAYDFLIPIAQLKPRPPQIDVTALPSADVLLQNLTGTAFGVSSDNDGLAIAGYSPTGIVSLTTIGIAGAIKDRRAAAGQNGAGGGGGGGGAMQQRKRTVLDAIGKGLQAYSKDNNGNFPAALADLQPKYLPGLTTELGFVTFIGKQDQPNKVVAHSSEKLPGPITVLMQDGSVTEIRRDQLGKTLKAGFTPEAQAAVPEGQGAKPQAPDF